MRYFKLTIPALLVLVFCLGCPKNRLFNQLKKYRLRKKYRLKRLKFP